MRAIVLVDYRDQFWERTDHKECSMDARLLASYLIQHGWDVLVRHYAELDMRLEDFSGVVIIYQSSEDPGLYYKGYIEDVLLALKLKGAILVPEFHLFRAHHNKVFMELLRDISSLDAIKQPAAKAFGTYEEYHYAMERGLISAPQVLKLADGAQSKNVRLLRTPAQLKSVPHWSTITLDLYYWFVDQVKPLWPSRYPNYRRKSHRRRKFIVQQFVPGLSGDFKVIVFGNRYYVLSRRVRDNDFRASGSGKFSFPDECLPELLSFAKTVHEYFDAPFISLDVAQPNDGGFVLLEFQFVNFGCYTLEKSPHWYSFNDGTWQKHEGQSVLEEEFSRSVVEYVRRHPLSTLRTPSSCAS